MHIPDGYLGPVTYGGLWAVMAPVWYFCSRKVRNTLKVSEVPLLALGAAVSFVIMMFNIPFGVTTGHATGAVLLAIVLGPWAAVIALSIALAIQAFLFGDGGITALGANCFNIAFSGTMTGYLVFKLLAGKNRGKRFIMAAGIGGYVGINLSGLLAAFELGLQQLLHRAPDGRPLYSPFPLSVTLPSVMVGHLTLFGLVEAVFTVLSLAYIIKSHPELVRGLP